MLRHPDSPPFLLGTRRTLRHPCPQPGRSPLVRLRYPRRVGLQRRGPAIPVPEPPGDGPRIDTAHDQLRRRVVPQLVECRLDPELLRHPVVALGHAVRRREYRPVGGGAEHEHVRRQLDPEHLGSLHGPQSQVLEYRDSLGVERDPALLVGLEVTLDPAVLALADPALQPKRLAALFEIEPRPAGGAQFAPAGPGRHRRPDQGAPVRVVPRPVEELRGLLGTRRPRVRLRCRRRLGLRERVHPDPPPADGTLVGTGQDEVDVPDRRRRQRLALMWTASVVALVVLASPMVNEP
ncbi:hypothetical protein Ae707Ps1_4330 [Pseudonocardia sp. Ae707_Ps1]|nr:hypothetical protein Ae707Ps1_4330 [Pseudonocardia sp. Ae707_Ps1]